MRRVVAMAQRLAQREGLPVLIQGESGTGKERFWRVRNSCIKQAKSCAVRGGQLRADTARTH